MNELKIVILKCQVPLVSLLQYIFLSHSLTDVFYQRYRQNGRILGLRLSIYSSQGFYKKITTSEIKLDKDLLK